MEIEEFHIDGVFAFTPRVFKDERGNFFESFNQKLFDEMAGKNVQFCQDNQSVSKQFVLRGIHFQKPPFAQGKLVRVIRGSVLDVAVDLRPNSSTYGEHVKVLISAENNKQFWIPEGFGHGFVALEDDTIFSYKCTNFYDKESEGGLNWDDPDLKIDWELGHQSPVLSEKDQIAINFSEFKSPF